MKIVNVLLVEDNPGDVELVREALNASALPHRLQLANDFEEARTCIENIATGTPCPDIVLIDINLPKGSGLELLRILRLEPKCKSVPVIVVSSSNSAHDRARAAEFDVAHYFRKPVDLEEFMKLGPLVGSVVDKAGAA
jgi:chemotaxis family two-component system response regulator Rcp1